MVILKRVRASSLMETLIATVLIMGIFVLASLILNNVFSNSIKNNKRGITARIHELEYQYLHDGLPLPYRETFTTWDISVDRDIIGATEELNFKAMNRNTQKVVETKWFK